MVHIKIYRPGDTGAGAQIEEIGMQACGATDSQWAINSTTDGKGPLTQS